MVNLQRTFEDCVSNFTIPLFYRTNWKRNSPYFPRVTIAHLNSWNRTVFSTNHWSLNRWPKSKKIFVTWWKLLKIRCAVHRFWMIRKNCWIALQLNIRKQILNKIREVSTPLLIKRYRSFTHAHRCISEYLYKQEWRFLLSLIDWLIGEYESKLSSCNFFEILLIIAKFLRDFFKQNN